MRLHREPVKTCPTAASSKGKWSRRFEGWPLIIPSVGIALLATWLALPQATFPEHLPLPTFTPDALQAARQTLAAQAAQVHRHELSYEVRAIGERVRQIGRAEANGTAVSVEQRQAFRNQVARTLAQAGAPSLLALRAIQAELFTAATQAFEQTGHPNDELHELGGNFLALCRTEGWLREGAVGQVPDRVGEPPSSRGPNTKGSRERVQLLLNTDERQALFLMRWTELSGLSRDSSFRLREPWVSLAMTPRLRAPIAQLSAQALPAIARLGEANHEYPTEVAKGLLLTKLGAYREAVESYREYLARFPNGPYSVRARNHLLYAQGRASTAP